MWIELHDSLWSHRKTIALSELLDIEPDRAAAYCARLWTWALANAPDGMLNTCTARAIAFGAGWHGVPDTFVHAMISAGFIDADLTLHNWEKYALKLIERRRANADRMREARAKLQHDSKKNTSATRVQHVRNTSGKSAVEKSSGVRARVELPDLTGPNRTIDNSPGNPPSVSAADATVAPELPSPLVDDDVDTRSPLAVVIETVRAAGLTITTTGRDGKALKDSSADPHEVAACFIAIARGEWGDDFTRRRLSVHVAVESLNGYRSRGVRPIAPARDGRPEPKALTRSRGGGHRIAELMRQQKAARIATEQEAASQ